MLVLSRKKDQTVVIDGQIQVQVLKIKGNTVRIGISAPSDVKVLRGELSPFEIDVPMSDFAPEKSPPLSSEALGQMAGSFVATQVS